MPARPGVFAAVFVAAALFLSSAAWAQVVTPTPTFPPPPPNPPRTCGIGKEIKPWCESNQRADLYTPFGCGIGCNPIVYCQNPTTPPVPDIECQAVDNNGSFLCLGSPQSETTTPPSGLTYTWTGTFLGIDQANAHSAYVVVDCLRWTANANLVLKVTAPGNVTSTVSKTLNCAL